jgi:hypothetical protein
MVKLISVIGHGTNLIPHFINHYKNQVDEICFAVYVTDKYPDIESEVKEIIKDFNNVKIVLTFKDRIYDWDKVTQMYNYIKSKDINSWWVVADIDEFHLYSKPLKEIISDCESNSWELVRGGFIDRIGPDGTFPKILNAISIWHQFPNAGFFRYIMSNACPNKVCIMKGYVEVTSGQHYARIGGQTTWRWQGWNHPLIAPFEEYSVQVHHFKWDETSIERIFDVAAVNEDYSFSKEYDVMYKELKRNNFVIDLDNTDYMFEKGLIHPEFEKYKYWNKLIKKIISI